MATATYTILLSNMYGSLGPEENVSRLTNYDIYNSGIESLTSHQIADLANNQQESSDLNNVHSIKHSPQYYLRDRYAEQLTYSPEPLTNDSANLQKKIYNYTSIIPNNIDGSYAIATTNHTHPVNEQIADKHNVESNNQNQTSSGSTTQSDPPESSDDQQYQSQVNRVQPEHQISNNPSKPPLPIPRRSLSNSVNSYESETAKKRNNLSPQIKPNKSSGTRAPAVKQREGIREQKQNNGNNLVTKKKSHPNPSIDDKENHISKPKQNKNLSHSVPRQHTIRRNDFETEDNTNAIGEDNINAIDKENDISKPKQNKNLSHSVPRHHTIRRNDFETEDNTNAIGEDNTNAIDKDNTNAIDGDNNDVHTQDKSASSTEVSDTTHKKTPPLPPVRRGQGPPAYDPALTYPLPYGHPLQGRYPYYDGFQSDRHHPDANDDLPDPATHPDPDHKDMDSGKNQTKSKSEKTENENATFETSPQEKNDNPKKIRKSTIHDTLYSQHWKSTDSYLENQRRRALRDTQGYYFPYKKYTLKDYKHLQKAESQCNLYGSYDGNGLDRKERMKKRQEYAAKIERPVVDTVKEGHKTSRDTSHKKSSYLNNGESHESEKASKRDRALEYVKNQLVKPRIHKPSKPKINIPDPTEQYINSLFPEVDENPDSEVNGQYD